MTKMIIFPTSKQIKKMMATFLAGVLFAQSAYLLNAAESNFWMERNKSRLSSVKQETDTLKFAQSVSTDPSILLASAGPLPMGLSMPMTQGALNQIGLNGQLSDQQRKALSQKWIPEWMQKAILPHALIQEVDLAKNPDAKRILIVQDVHLHHQAQQKIAAAITDLSNASMAEGSPILVGLEGAEIDEVDFKEFNEYQHQSELKEVANAFLKENYINGIEFAAVGYEGKGVPYILPFTVTGVEKNAEYEENVQALRDSIPMRTGADQALKDFKASLVQFKAKEYNADLHVFDNKQSSFSEGQLSAPEYVLYLDSKSAAQGENSRDLIEAALLEGSIDFKKVEQERSVILSQLIKKISDEEVQNLVKISALYRSGHIKYADYYDYLKKLCLRNGVDLKKYSEMGLYIQYVVKSEGIDAARLFSEIQGLEKEVKRKLFRAETQQKIANLSEYYLSLNKLSQHILTEEEWFQYLEQKNDLSSIQERFAELNAQAPASMVKMKTQWPTFEAFYTTALKRNHTMAARLMAKLNAFPGQTAVMVVGGFHSKGLAKELKKHDVTVLTMSPKISKLEDGPSSLDILAETYHPLDQLFKGERLFLPIRPLAARQGGLQTLLAVANAITGQSNATGSVAARILGPGEKAGNSVQVGDKNIRLERNSASDTNPRSGKALKTLIISMALAFAMVIGSAALYIIFVLFNANKKSPTPDIEKAGVEAAESQAPGGDLTKAPPGGRILWLKAWLKPIFLRTGLMTSQNYDQKYDKNLVFIENGAAFIAGLLGYSAIAGLGFILGVQITQDPMIFLKSAYAFGWVIFAGAHLGDLNNPKVNSANKYFGFFIAGINILLLPLLSSAPASIAIFVMIVIPIITHEFTNRIAPAVSAFAKKIETLFSKIPIPAFLNNTSSKQGLGLDVVRAVSISGLLSGLGATAAALISNSSVAGHVMTFGLILSAASAVTYVSRGFEVRKNAQLDSAKKRTRKVDGDTNQPKRASSAKAQSEKSAPKKTEPKKAPRRPQAPAKTPPKKAPLTNPDSNESQASRGRISDFGRYYSDISQNVTLNMLEALIFPDDNEGQVAFILAYVSVMGDQPRAKRQGMARHFKDNFLAQINGDNLREIISDGLLKGVKLDQLLTKIEATMPDDQISPTRQLIFLMFFLFNKNSTSEGMASSLELLLTAHDAVIAITATSPDTASAREADFTAALSIEFNSKPFPNIGGPAGKNQIIVLLDLLKFFDFKRASNRFADQFTKMAKAITASFPTGSPASQRVGILSKLSPALIGFIGRFHFPVTLLIVLAPLLLVEVILQVVGKGALLTQVGRLSMAYEFVALSLYLYIVFKVRTAKLSRSSSEELQVESEDAVSPDGEDGTLSKPPVVASPASSSGLGLLRRLVPALIGFIVRLQSFFYGLIISVASISVAMAWDSLPSSQQIGTFISPTIFLNSAYVPSGNSALVFLVVVALLSGVYVLLSAARQRAANLSGSPNSEESISTSALHHNRNIKVVITETKVNGEVTQINVSSFDYTRHTDNPSSPNGPVLFKANIPLNAQDLSIAANGQISYKTLAGESIHVNTTIVTTLGGLAVSLQMTGWLSAGAVYLILAVGAVPAVIFLRAYVKRIFKAIFSETDRHGLLDLRDRLVEQYSISFNPKTKPQNKNAAVQQIFEMTKSEFGFIPGLQDQLDRSVNQPSSVFLETQVDEAVRAAILRSAFEPFKDRLGDRFSKGAPIVLNYVVDGRTFETTPIDSLNMAKILSDVNMGEGTDIENKIVDYLKDERFEKFDTLQGHLDEANSNGHGLIAVDINGSLATLKQALEKEDPNEVVAPLISRETYDTLFAAADDELKTFLTRNKGRIVIDGRDVGSDGDITASLSHLLNNPFFKNSVTSISIVTDRKLTVDRAILNAEGHAWTAEMLIQFIELLPIQIESVDGTIKAQMVALINA